MEQVQPWAPAIWDQGQQATQWRGAQHVTKKGHCLKARVEGRCGAGRVSSRADRKCWVHLDPAFWRCAWLSGGLGRPSAEPSQPACQVRTVRCLLHWAGPAGNRWPGSVLLRVTVSEWKQP